MFASMYHILALTKIRRTRTFSGKGNIMVRPGQKVNAAETLAEYQSEEQFKILNIKKLLGFSNSEDARRSINVKIGDKLVAGDEVAEKKGLFSDSVTVDSDCEVVHISGHQVLLSEKTVKIPLHAGFDSVVTEILPERGVILETDGVLIQGVWGNQKATSGLLVPLIDSADIELTPNMIDVTYRGAIILGGTVTNPETLTMANTIPLKGIVLGSMHPDLIPIAQAIDVAVIVIDGFGTFPMNKRAFELLHSNAKRNISVNGIYQKHMNEKPELVIPLPTEGYLPSEAIEFKQGQVVRVNCAPYQGQAGKIKKINPGFYEFSNELQAQSALIQFPNDDQAMIPLANLDVLE